MRLVSLEMDRRATYGRDTEAMGFGVIELGAQPTPALEHHQQRLVGVEAILGLCVVEDSAQATVQTQHERVGALQEQPQRVGLLGNGHEVLQLAHVRRLEIRANLVVDRFAMHDAIESVVGVELRANLVLRLLVLDASKELDRLCRLL